MIADDDHWVKILRCPRCEKTGPAELSQMNGSLDVAVDSLPEGFKVVETEYGIDFLLLFVRLPGATLIIPHGLSQRRSGRGRDVRRVAHLPSFNFFRCEQY
jgi:hypothetical protein